MKAANSPVLNLQRRVAHVDGMRAAAVMLVVIAHAGLGHVVPGGSGVTIFFAVSGYIITYLLLRERDKTDGFQIGGFYFRRAAKIFPPFAVIVVVPTLIWSLFRPLDWWDFAAEVFFIFNWVYIPGGVEVLPGSAVVWSLAVEEQFYIAFALIWLLLVRARSWRRALVVGSVAVLVWSTTSRVVLALQPEAERRIYYGTDTRIDAIALGVLTAVLIHHWTRSGQPSTWYARVLGKDWVFLLAIGLYLASLLIRDEWFRNTFRYSFQALAACAILAYGFLPGESVLKRAFISVSAWKPVALIGLASYSIYLVHLSLASALRPLVDGWPLAVSVPVLVAIGVAAGIVIYLVVEVPVLNWRKRRDEAVRRPRVPALENVGLDTGI